MADRKPSEATLKTRAFRRWADAEAKAKKAENAAAIAEQKHDAAVQELAAAAEECRKLGVPIAGE